MQIEIKARQFQLTEALRLFVLRRVQFAMRRIGAQVMHVTVRLSDINGPKGGVDKRCQLNIRVEGQPDIVIDDTETDLYTAIKCATERAGQTLRRKLQQSHRVSAKRVIWKYADE